MDLRDYARPFTWEGITLFYLPMRTAAVDIEVDRLNSLTPRVEYVNAKTGQRSATKPDDLLEAEKQADSRAKVTKRYRVPKTDWAEHELWDVRHNSFCVCLPLIVAVESAELDAQTPIQVRMLADFLNNPIEDFASRWKTFSQFITLETLNALWRGYEQTRDGGFEPLQSLEDVEGSDDNSPLAVTEPSTDNS